MKNVFGLFSKGISAFVISAGVFAAMVMAPTSGHAGLLGTIAGGTYNIGLSPLNYFDPAAVPGVPPVPALVVDPGVEFHGNGSAIQATFPSLTASANADLTDSAIFLTWLNQGISSTLIPAETFIFDLFPPGQKVSGVVFNFGLSPAGLSIDPSGHIVTITYDPFLLGGGSSTFAHYSLSFVNVPEPGTYLLLGSMAAVALFAASRRRAEKVLS